MVPKPYLFEPNNFDESFTFMNFVLSVGFLLYIALGIEFVRDRG